MKSNTIKRKHELKKDVKGQKNRRKQAPLLPAVLQDQRGFTLIELMVVVAIIAVLAAISIPLFTGQMDKAKYGRAEAEMNSQVSLLKLSYVENLAYPSDTAFKTLLSENGLDPEASDPWGTETYKYVLEDDASFKLTCWGSDKANGKADTGNKWAADIVFTGAANGMVTVNSANTEEPAEEPAA